MSDVEVTPGDNAMFEVHVPDQPGLDWYKEGILIEDEGRFVIEDAVEGDQLYRLTVENCESSDHGTYTCLIKTDHGETQCSAKLVISKPLPKEVIEKPSQVKPLSTTPGKATFEPEKTSTDQKTKAKFGKDLGKGPKEVIEKPSKVTPLSTAPERAKFEPQGSPDHKTKKFAKDTSLQPTVRAKPSPYEGKDYADENGALRKKFEPQGSPDHKTKKLAKDTSLQPTVRAKPSPYEGKDYADANGALRKKTPVDIPPGKRKVLEPMEGLAAKPKFLKELKGGRVR